MRVPGLFLLAGLLAIGSTTLSQQKADPSIKDQPVPALEKEQPSKQEDDKKADSKKKDDGLRDPYVEMQKRVEKETMEKNYKDMKDAAEELATLTRKMSDEITQGGKDVISGHIFADLDRIEKLAKQVRDKAKSR